MLGQAYRFEEGQAIKTTYVRDILLGSFDETAPVSVLGWVKGKRDLGRIVFLELCDSTGVIQAVATPLPAPGEDSGPPRAAGLGPGSNVFLVAKSVHAESAVRAEGTLRRGPDGCEVRLTSLDVVGPATLDLRPRPRERIDILDGRLATHLLNHRHLYLRNDRIAAVMLFRHRLLGAVHSLFREWGFVEVNTPVLTPIPLYEDRTAIAVEVGGRKAFLTQCAGFYLESAVHVFEKVYTIGPSFRSEETHSPRHLMEYWHIKAELAWVDLADLMTVAEDLIRSMVEFCRDECSDLMEAAGTRLMLDGLETPYPRLSYPEAVDRLGRLGFSLPFGQSLGADAERALSGEFSTPFWVTGLPRNVEPFPYRIDEADPRLTRTADLIASRGFGELLGVAEKITNMAEFNERMTEKGKAGDERYGWVGELREFGCVPHGGIGLGFERLLRWLLGFPHIRDTVPFPRVFRRRIFP